MTVSHTTCMHCGAVIELDDEFGWEKFDEGAKHIECVGCIAEMVGRESD